MKLSIEKLKPLAWTRVSLKNYVNIDGTLWGKVVSVFSVQTLRVCCRGWLNYFGSHILLESEILQGKIFQGKNLLLPVLVSTWH